MPLIDTYINPVYSIDDENYFDDIDDILDIISSDFKPGEIKDIYIAEKQTFTHSDFVDGSDIIEHITNFVYDNHGEYAENYCYSLDSNKEIFSDIENLIIFYLNNKVPQPSFFGVKNVQKILLDDIIDFPF